MERKTDLSLFADDSVCYYYCFAFYGRNAFFIYFCDLGQFLRGGSSGIC